MKNPVQRFRSGAKTDTCNYPAPWFRQLDKTFDVIEPERANVAAYPANLASENYSRDACSCQKVNDKGGVVVTVLEMFLGALANVADRVFLARSLL